MFTTAKEQEKRQNYLIMNNYGYFRPTSEERKLIRERFKKIGKTIHGLGYDLIDKETKTNLPNVNFRKICLYELKSTKEGKNIDSEFNRFSFGVSINEIKNYKELKSQFKIIYLNCASKKIKILPFSQIPIISVIGYQCVVGTKKATLDINRLPFCDISESKGVMS